MALKRHAHRKLAHLVSLAVMALGLVAAVASGDDLGPPVGASLDIGAPSDHTGQPRTLPALAGANGLVLLFYRSADWCPICQAQLIDLNNGLSEIEARGYRLAAMSYDSPETLAMFAEARGIQFPLLSDPNSEVIERHGLRDPQYPQTSMAYGVPRPIIFVLTTQGVITDKLFDETYKTRPPLSAVLEALD